MSRVLDLTRELVARPSVTPDDAGCQRLISERLLPLGFDVEWFLSGPVTMWFRRVRRSGGLSYRSILMKKTANCMAGGWPT